MTKNPAAVALGRLGGQSRSKRKVAAARANALKGSKSAAARANGKKGGRPKKNKPVNLEPMNVKVEMWDGDGNPVKARVKVVDAKAGKLAVSHPPMTGKYRVRVSVTEKPAKGKKR